jgi:hypothetical protein
MPKPAREEKPVLLSAGFLQRVQVEESLLRKSNRNPFINVPRSLKK